MEKINIEALIKKEQTQGVASLTQEERDALIRHRLIEDREDENRLRVMPTSRIPNQEKTGGLPKIWGAR